MLDLHSAASDVVLLDALSRKPLLALDFDGTLSPLVPEPAAAAIDPRVPPLLPALMALMPVAIVSGRGLPDLARRVAIAGLTLVGNHGNEWGPSEVGTPAGADGRNARQRQICLDWTAALAAPLAALGQGLAFESKTVSLSIHYRLTEDREQMRLKLLALIEQLRPRPEIIEGKFVFNLMAPGLVTKYEAIVELVSRYGAGTAIFVGDDVTDERVFERAPPDWLTVRVWDDERSAPGAGETAASSAALSSEGSSAARAFVQRVDGVVELLERLLRISRNL